MRKFLKTILWFFVSLLIVIILCAGTAAFFLFYRQNDIKEVCVSQINEILDTKVAVDKMKVGFDGYFASLVFENVQIPSGNKKDTTLFVSAKKAALDFNIWDIIQGKYILKKIKISEADVNVIFYKNGKKSYEIWKKNQDSTSVDFFLQMNSIDILYTQVNFIHQTGEQDYSAYVEKVIANANFSNNLSILKIDSKFLLEHLKSDTSVYLKNNLISLQTTLTIDEKITFSKTKVNIDDVVFDADAEIEDDFISVNLDIFKQKIEKIIDILPENLTNSLKDKNLNGNISCNLALFSDKIDNPEKYSLSFKNIETNISNSIIYGDLHILNLYHPKISLDFSYDLICEKLPFQIKNTDKLDGKLSGKISVNQNFNSFDDISIDKVLKSKFSISAHSNNLKIKLADSILASQIKIDSLCFNLDKNSAILDFINFKYDDIEVKGKLNLNNFLNFIFDDEKMKVSGRVEVGDLLIKENTNENKSQVGESYFALPEINNIDIDVFAKLKSFKFQKWYFEEIETFIYKVAQSYKFYDFTAKTLDGDIFLRNFEFRNQENGYFPVKFDGIVANINSSKLFETMDNFEQNIITDKKISGNIDADISGKAYYSWKEGLNYDLLNIDFDVQINNGKLKNVELLQKLSAFIDEDILSNVSFQQIRNKIQIKDKKIIIPQMNILSNAVDLTIVAEHHFSGEMDYKIKVALSEILSRKRREKRRAEIVDGEEVAKNRTSIYVSVSGNSDNPKFKYNLGKLKNFFDNNKEIENPPKISEKVKKELKTQTSEKKLKQQEQEKGNFIIDWEEKNLESSEKSPIIDKKSKTDSLSVKIEWDDD